MDLEQKIRGILASSGINIGPGSTLIQDLIKALTGQGGGGQSQEEPTSAREMLEQLMQREAQKQAQQAASQMDQHFLKQVMMNGPSSPLEMQMMQEAMSKLSGGWKVNVPKPKTRPPKMDLLKEAEISVLVRKIQHILKENTASEMLTGFRSGKLQANKLYKVKTNNPRIFSRRKAKKKAGYNISLVADCSGSMHGGRLDTATKAMINTSKILGKIKGVHVMAYGFADRTEKLLDSNERVDPKKAEEMRKKCYDGSLGGGTQLGRAVETLAREMPIHNNNASMIMSYSDGDADYGETQAGAKFARKLGIRSGLIEIDNAGGTQKLFDDAREVAHYVDVYPATLKMLTKFVNSL